MKINWGTGIVLAFIGFISFIMYFVVTMSTDNKYNHDLVTEDYYKQELNLQNNIYKEENAKKLKHNITYKKTNRGILLIFPENFDEKKITGKVFLYRPSNKQFDFETAISLSNHNLLIPETRLLGGRWNIIVDWNYNDTPYRFTKEIIY
ncbi:cytochrome Cbb3 oxidase maturation protein CcoH [Tamlana sedimentorum]|uniref:Cytochrome Cbb3 oxidase maturation protein CcoH n=1 Tax=Neotamlana sedimentorum TaxID=1435349 RepID=A0A0D7W2C2_9FLAO|nr:FixH family protein [Tamlana sedimentorum]KJD33209.1 cytochrome Cbb3 oxidase maturation protein CcoH [Tamlana sedimentorum]